MRRLTTTVILTLLVAAACGADPPDTAIAPTRAGIVTETTLPVDQRPEYLRANEPCNRPDDQGVRPTEPGVPPPFALEEVTEVDNPTVIAFAPDGRAFIGSRTGQISLWDGAGRPLEVLDLSDSTTSENDQGLLGLTVSPDGRWLYVNRTDGDGDSRISAFSIENGVDDREQVILGVEQPSRLHNGGDLAFAPDGTLFASFGDGGGLGDRYANGQDRTTLLGAILRLDPRPGGDPPYLVPDDNPFVGRDDANPLIWASGVRHPFRFSFDAPTGTLWIGDLGQQCKEEIDVLGPEEAGANLGWNVFESDRPFVGSLAAGEVHRAPDLSYWHTSRWCAIVGGHVYRGRALPDLVGSYVFTDFCGPGLAIVPVDRSEMRATTARVDQPVDISADPDGELYVVSMGGPIYKIVATDATRDADQ